MYEENVLLLSLLLLRCGFSMIAAKLLMGFSCELINIVALTDEISLCFLCVYVFLTIS